MGTNYYLHENVCEHCGRGDSELHIGKYSAGWCFALHAIIPSEYEDAKPIASLEDWKAKFSQPNTVIKDEYGDTITADEMLSIITECGPREQRDDPGGPYDNWDDFYRKNHCLPGPDNMLRRRLDGRHCIAHGEGTWDMITGEFL